MIDPKFDLTSWEHNYNGTNIYNIPKDFLVPNFINVFQTISEKISKNKYQNICKLWISTCDEEIQILKQNLENVLKENIKNKKELDDNICSICNKFRGNLGEIFAEHFFKTHKGNDYIEGDDYQRVDPENEKGINAFIDATSKDSRFGNIVGIQIKNLHGSVTGKEFHKWKTKAESTALKFYQRGIVNFNEMKSLTDETYRPCQFIFSFTKLLSRNDNWEKTSEYYDCGDTIIFLGPEYINSKNLQNSPKFFKEIVDKIISKNK